MFIKKLTEQQKTDISSEWSEGIKTEEIAKKYNICQDTVRRIAKAYNMKRPKNRMIKLTKQQQENLIKEYKTGENTLELSKKYNISTKTISRLTGKYNMTRPIGKITYDVNEMFFNNIKSEKQAYWLGFFVADGHIGTENNLQFNLAYKDIYHLIQFRKDISSNHPINIIFSNNKNPQGVLHITRKQISIDLNNLGFNNHKTGNEHFPRQLPFELYNSFIRGFFDGDGSVCIQTQTNKGKNKNINISFGCSNLEFLKNIQNILVKECNLNYTKISNWQYKKYYELIYSGNIQCTRIAKYLWQGANIYLPRKINKILNSELLKEEIKLGTYLDY